jgi:hypothetical protein
VRWVGDQVLRIKPESLVAITKGRFAYHRLGPEELSARIERLTAEAFMIETLDASRQKALGTHMRRGGAHRRDSKRTPERVYAVPGAHQERLGYDAFGNWREATSIT